MTALTKEMKEAMYDPTTYGKVEHGDMILKDGLITQKTFGSESTGLKSGYPMDAFKISNPADVAKSIEYMEFYDREFGTVLHLDTKNRIVGTEIVSIGSINSAVIHPREVFKKAVLSNSAAIIFVHNHPSGDAAPSREDTAISEKLGDVGNIIGIPLLDSMIIGREGKYYSYKEAGMLPTSGGLNKAFDPIKRCEPSINAALERKGIEPDTVDVRALIDSTLSCDENSKLILRSLNARKTDKYQDAARKMAQYYQGKGKLANASPSQRAAAFAAMREAGTLRGYDPASKKVKRNTILKIEGFESKYNSGDKWDKYPMKLTIEQDADRTTGSDMTYITLDRTYPHSKDIGRVLSYGHLTQFTTFKTYRQQVEKGYQIDLKIHTNRFQNNVDLVISFVPQGQDMFAVYFFENNEREVAYFETNEEGYLQIEKLQKKHAELFFDPSNKPLKMIQDYGGFLVSIPYDVKLIERIKMMDGKWNPRLKMWFVPQIWEGELISMTKGHITKWRTIAEIEAEQKRGY